MLSRTHSESCRSSFHRCSRTYPSGNHTEKIHRAIDSGTDIDIDGLTAQLAALEHDPEAIVEDGYDVSNAIGKALALIDQVKSSFFFVFEPLFT
jgi:hypothetical protein